MKVWIDMSNSPHPLLFSPLARSLEERGVEVLITFRDHAQTRELTLQRWPEATRIGEPSRAGALGKLETMTGRVRAGRRWARAAKPDVALSHNSYAQILAARLAGVPVVTAMDYEHQPVNHFAFRAAQTILLPEAIPPAVVRRQGARGAKVVRYPGLKEELYLADFRPRENVLAELGIERSPGTAVVVARAAAAGAAYHPRENPLFVRALQALAGQAHVRCVVLARHEHQRAEIESLRLPNTLIPRAAVDARSLLCVADLFVGAGGTMSREAALLGVPSLSMFAGKPAAVDAWLEREGKLQRLERLEQLAEVRPRAGHDADLRRLREAAEPIKAAFIRATEDAAGVSR